VSLPAKVKPMTATTGTMPPEEAEWAFEIKRDGVRALCYVEDGRLHMESRNLLYITARCPDSTAGRRAGRRRPPQRHPRRRDGGLRPHQRLHVRTTYPTA
jgi:ATP-dependent DNA ligase